MKKKLKIFVMCFLLLATTLFTGCSLVEIDNDKLYNSVVAEIYNKEGAKVETITNRELLTAYSNYGSVYQQYYNYSKKEAVDMSLKQLENRKIVILTAEKEFNINSKTGEGLEDKEKTYLYEETESSLLTNLDSYYKEIIGETEEEKSSDEVKFNGYEKKVTLEEEIDEKGNVNYVIKLSEEAKGLLDDFSPVAGNKDFFNYSDREQIYTRFIDKALTSENYEKALKLYIVDLKSAEYGMKLSSNTKSLFEREMERLYKINYENYMVQKYSEKMKNDSRISSVTSDDILKLYSSKVRADYTKYVIENSSEYDSTISSSSSSMYYFNNNSSTKYFTVANILFKFSDEQTAEYERIEKKAQSGDIYTTYQQDLDSLYQSIIPVVREERDGEKGVYDEKTTTQSVNDIIRENIIPVLAGAQKTNDVNVIGDTINSLIYTYNQDPGMFNADSNYVIGVDSEGKAVSSFVEEFNEAGLKLYNNGYGKIGDIEVTRSSFGIHVLVYTGECSNLFSGINENFELNANSKQESGKDAINVLYTTRVNLLVDKTYFDVLYDEIFADNYSYFEQANIGFLREDYTIKVYSGRYPDNLKG